MAFVEYKTDHIRRVAAEDALFYLNGLGITLVENQDYCYKHHPKSDNPRECKCNVFWWTTRGFKERYKQEEAKVGDTFFDGNNGDKHEVIAVDRTNCRLVYRNLEQNEDLLFLACW